MQEFKYRLNSCIIKIKVVSKHVILQKNSSITREN